MDEKSGNWNKEEVVQRSAIIRFKSYSRMSLISYVKSFYN